MEKKHNSSIVKGAVVAAGVATAVAAIAATYFFYGSKNAPKNRQKIKAWMLKAKGEILEQIENASEINEKIYHNIIKEVSEKYQVLKNLDKKDVDDFAGEMKKYWKHISRKAGVPVKK